MLEITAFWYGKPNLLCPVRKLCCIGRLLQPLISYREMQATNIVSTQVPLINFHRLPTYLPTHLPTYRCTTMAVKNFLRKATRRITKMPKDFFAKTVFLRRPFIRSPFIQHPLCALQCPCRRQDLRSNERSSSQQKSSPMVDIGNDDILSNEINSCF